MWKPRSNRTEQEQNFYNIHTRRTASPYRHKGLERLLHLLSHLLLHLMRLLLHVMLHLMHLLLNLLLWLHGLHVKLLLLLHWLLLHWMLLLLHGLLLLLWRHPAGPLGRHESALFSRVLPRDRHLLPHRI